MDEVLECSSCAEDRLKPEIQELGCRHQTCIICLEKHIVNQIKKKNHKINCPISGCEKIVGYEIIRKTMPDDDFDRYDRLVLKAALPGLVSCLNDECDFFLETEDGPERTKLQFKCAQCSLFNCVDCKKPHSHLSCHQFSKLTSLEAEKQCAKELDRAQKFLQNKKYQEYRDRLEQAASADLVENSTTFECPVCCMQIPRGEGVTLKQCFHQFCKDDLQSYVRSSKQVVVKCPDAYCNFALQDCEIRSCLTEAEVNIYERRSIARVRSQLVGRFKCRQVNCEYLCELKNRKSAKHFTCPKCQSHNCLECDAVHSGMKCSKYQQSQKLEEGAAAALNAEAILRGEYMECCNCNHNVAKISGCNWIQCDMCGLELCWVLKMPRWGPKGRGDNSGGCKCFVQGVRCHPECSGCLPHDYTEEELLRDLLPPCPLQ